MSRFEENKLLFDRIVKMSEHKPEGTFEEMMVFQAAAIASVLTDISKSVAVIADRAENERLKKALEQEHILDKIKEEIKENTYFINETTEKEGIDFETVEKIIDKYKVERSDTE